MSCKCLHADDPSAKTTIRQIEVQIAPSFKPPLTINFCRGVAAGVVLENPSLLRTVASFACESPRSLLSCCTVSTFWHKSLRGSVCLESPDCRKASCLPVGRQLAVGSARSPTLATRDYANCAGCAARAQSPLHTDPCTSQAARTMTALPLAVRMPVLLRPRGCRSSARAHARLASADTSSAAETVRQPRGVTRARRARTRCPRAGG